MFTIALDPARALLRIDLAGYWDAPTMDRFEADMPAALARLRDLAGSTSCLIDASDFPVQGRDIADRHARLLAGLEGAMADHVAVVVPGALVRSQARRIADTPRRFFSDTRAAMDWLTAARAA
ncbi:MAG: hypothetical protein PGN09_04360 [Sphingomonas fennica]